MDNKNLWAPWRMPYIQGLAQKSPCFLCDYIGTAAQDSEHLVLWRTQRCIVVFNQFPYNNGHLLIAPLRHIPSLEQAADDELLEMIQLVRESQKVLSLAIHPHGFNVGMNFGRCAGAGLPEHLHIHIVPRWEGDTNFMSVCSQTKVISQSLSELYEVLTRLSREHHLPTL